MQIVINISEEVFKRLVAGKVQYGGITARNIFNSVKEGTPLPKGHGRLFDERDIVNGNYEVIGNRIYELESIIEADKAERSNKK